MAFTKTQLAALEFAIGSGELKVEYDGKKIEYRSMSDLVQARDLVKRELIASGQLQELGRSNRGPASLATFTRD